jgi:DNA polymerase-3 subunit beta
MKFQAEQKTLAKMLAATLGVVERRNTLPILANVAITATSDAITMRATDLDIEHTMTTPVTVTREGGITVNAAMLGDVVKRLPSGSLVDLDAVDGFLIIKAGRSEFKLATMPIDDFPFMASHEYQVTFPLPAQELHRLFALSKVAMSTEETRYYLCGVYLHNEQGHIRAVATDAAKLACIDGPDVVDFPGVIIPTKTVMELLKQDAVGDVHVSVSETKIKFDYGSSVIVSKVVDGTYPEYRRIIPVSNNNHLTANGASIRTASDRVLAVSDDKARAVKFDIAATSLVISVAGSNGNEAKDELEVTYTGDPMKISFNSKLLADCVSQTNGGSVTIEMNTPMDPALIRGDDLKAVWVIQSWRG